MRSAWPAAIFFTLYLAIQLLLPLYSHLSGSNRFRWSMFAGTLNPPDVTILHHNHTTESLIQFQKRTRRARILRKDLDQTQHLPPYLCATTPQPISIRIHNQQTGKDTTHPCQP